MRVSGPQACNTLLALAGRLPPPRRATRSALKNTSGETIDQALVLWFPGPASFTGEDVAEFHVHGGQAVIAAVLQALLAVPEVRLSEPGEFTRRAFEYGKLDLTAAEGLADLVDAETEGQRRQALRQMQGGLQSVYDGWRAQLLSIVALVEAEIDFPDEDLPDALASRADPLIGALLWDMSHHLNDRARGERIRDGYRIAIIGAPNAGKSSLLNALVGREAAIVSDIPGTTRDVVEARLTLAGFPVWLADTAGLRQAADTIEAEGIRRALARAEEADLRLIVIDAANPAPIADAAKSDDIVVWNKSDLNDAQASTPQQGAAHHHVNVSTKTGIGLAQLLGDITARVAQDLAASEAPAISRARHRVLVSQAATYLTSAQTAAAPELAAEHLRRAADALGRLTGRIDVEEVLGEIFGRFCIGK